MRVSLFIHNQFLSELPEVHPYSGYKALFTNKRGHRETGKVITCFYIPQLKGPINIFTNCMVGEMARWVRRTWMLRTHSSMLSLHGQPACHVQCFRGSYLLTQSTARLSARSNLWLMIVSRFVLFKNIRSIIFFSASIQYSLFSTLSKSRATTLPRPCKIRE